MSKPIMPKATALWLIDNTTLTFQQIGDFCGMHALQIQGLADEKKGILQPVNPIMNGQLTLEEVTRCEQNPSSTLHMSTSSYAPKKTRKSSRYTLLSKRADIPHAVLWLLRHYPQLTDVQVSRLIGTTRPTVRSIREGNHWNFKALIPQDPVLLGLCTQHTLQKLLGIV